MQWERLFEDLEDQLASEWEAERSALDSETERLRISRLELRARLRRIAADRTVVVIDVPDQRRLRAVVHDVGADWVAIRGTEDHGTTLMPLTAVTAIELDHSGILSSLDAPPPPRPLRERMTLGFVLRDLARRRVPLSFAVLGGGHRHGTIDRAGADHLDVALHDPGAPRRRDAVHGFCVIPLRSLVWARMAPSEQRVL
ncbi:MAG: hypothetical protein ACQEW8_09345 [Actinomycetota bacterium]